MATTTFGVSVTAPSGVAVASFTVEVAAPANAATTTFAVTVTEPPAYLQRFDGTALATVQLGRWNGSSIVWLSPNL